MFPTRLKSSAPFFGVICVTTQSACCAARGVQKSPTTPRTSSIGRTHRPSSSVRSLYSVRSTTTSPADVSYVCDWRSTRR